MVHDFTAEPLDAQANDLKRQWARVDNLCRLDRDEWVRARNCAFRSQIQRDLEREGLCRAGDAWEACPPFLG